MVWCDTGYNTPQTYKHAERIITDLNLNVFLYVPKQTTAHRDSVMGIPNVNAPEHTLFTEQVKLEPFKRAMNEHKPKVWFTNLRQGQTAFRDSIDAAAEAGVKCVIEPGGSVRDDEVIEAANEFGMALYFSGKRHFLH